MRLMMMMTIMMRWKSLMNQRLVRKSDAPFSARNNPYGRGFITFAIRACDIAVAPPPPSTKAVAVSAVASSTAS